MWSLPLIQASLQTAAVLLWCGRGFWRSYPSWTFYGLCAVVQNWWMLSAATNEQKAGVWSLFCPILLLALLDSVMELFLRLSRLYQRFHRDRWKWLAIPALLGAALGIYLVSDRLETPSDYYRALFLASSVVGSVCASVLALGWLASTPVRLPLNLRYHLLLLAIYIGVNAFAYSQYMQAKDQRLIQQILIYLPSIIMLSWSMLMTSDGELEAERESEMPESTLEQVRHALETMR